MRILVIEDEKKLVQAIKKVLEQESYAVDTAYNGNDGLDFATTEQYDVIILDRLLPGMDGIDICYLLRKENIPTPILMLTAKRQLHEKVEGLDAGADDYLSKPFAFDELFARIRALIRRSAKVDPMVLSVADLTLNTATFEVKRGTKLIKLSKKEFALLEYLMRNANTIVSKDQIMQHPTTKHKAAIQLSLLVRFFFGIHVENMATTTETIPKSNRTIATRCNPVNIYFYFLLTLFTSMPETKAINILKAALVSDIEIFFSFSYVPLLMY
jgi:DNA-binding response OmpR family regulator